MSATISPAAVAALRARFGDGAVDAQLAALDLHGEVVDEPLLWLRTALEGNFKFMEIERVARCACGARDSTGLGRFVFWNLLGLRRCSACGLLFVSPRLTADAVARTFNEGYFDVSHPDYWGSRREPVFRDVVRLLEGVGAQRVLDVGCGYGHFVRYAADRGLDATGCDVAVPAIEWGKRHLGVELFAGTLEDLDFTTESFDAVAMLDALYYVADPAAELARIRRLLPSGGYLLLRLRNNLAAAHRAAREARRPVGKAALPMPHLWAFTPSTISGVLGAAGFRVVAQEPGAYSRTALAAVQALAARTNRLLRMASPRFPIVTHSFHVVARAS